MEINTSPTIEETKTAHLEVYKKPCSTDEAIGLIHDFVKYREFADGINFPDGGRNFIDPKTISEFIESRKAREERECDYDEYKRKLKEMSPK